METAGCWWLSLFWNPYERSCIKSCWRGTLDVSLVQEGLWLGGSKGVPGRTETRYKWHCFFLEEVQNQMHQNQYLFKKDELMPRELRREPTYCADFVWETGLHYPPPFSIFMIHFGPPYSQTSITGLDRVILLLKLDYTMARSTEWQE